jgi:hypothetical protein
MSSEPPSNASNPPAFRPAPGIPRCTPAAGVGIAWKGDHVGRQAVVGELVAVAGDHRIEPDQDHRFPEAIRLDQRAAVRLHDDDRLAIDFNLCARPFAEHDAITDRQRRSDKLAFRVARAGANGEDIAFLRLVSGHIRDQDAALGYLGAFGTANNNAIMQGSEVHVHLLFLMSVSI